MMGRLALSFRRFAETFRKALGLVACAVLLAACAPADRSGQPGLAATEDLILWHSYRGAERATLEALVDDYNLTAADRGVRIVARAIPFDAFADKLSASLPRGKGPDVFIFAQDRLGGWVEGGDVIEPVGFWLTDEKRARYLPRMIEALTYQGVVYGVPLNFKSIALIRNADLAPSAPETTDQLVAIAKANSNPGAGNYGLVYEYANPDMQAALMHAFGGGVFDADLNPVLNSPANIASFELMLRWREIDKILLPEPNGSLVLSLFNDRKAPFAISGPWFMGEVSPDVNVAVSPLPSVPGAGPIQPWLLVEGAFVTAASKNPREAFLFAEFLTSDAAATRLAVEGRQLPSVASVYALAQIADDPVLSGFRAQLDQSQVLPNAPEMALFWSPGDIAMKQVIRAGRDPQDALNEAQGVLVASISAMRRVDEGEQ
jgi:arabinogalactan oligomer/maltooligosaccharide transport system substrate-binding protein